MSAPPTAYHRAKLAALEDANRRDRAELVIDPQQFEDLGQAQLRQILRRPPRLPPAPIAEAVNARGDRLVLHPTKGWRRA